MRGFLLKGFLWGSARRIAGIDDPLALVLYALALAVVRLAQAGHRVALLR